MFYRKYRPQKFSEISQPNDVAFALLNQLKTKKVVHAYLFIGSRGTGKTTTARILAKALNCHKLSSEGDPCDKCDTCKAISNGSFLDLIEIDAASNRGIDDIRELKDKIKLAPSFGSKKIYIIDEVHMLTSEAFNALLKTLEEPPEHATFILCTTEAHKVPETIKSRCQVFKFKRATLDQLVLRLSDIANKEKVKISKTDLEKIARASMGGFRDAETLLQQVVEGGLNVDSLVGKEGKNDLVEFVDSLIIKDTSKALKFIENIFADGADLHTWCLSLTYYLRDLLFISADASEGLIDVSPELFSFMDEQANKMTPLDIALMLEIFSQAQLSIKSAPIAQLPLEVAIVKVCSFAEDGKYNKPIINDPNGFDGLEHSSQDKLPKSTKFNTEFKSDKSFGKNKDSLGIKSNLSVLFSDIEQQWGSVLKQVKSHNHGIEALLKSAKPLEIDSDHLVIEVFYKFHKERLETHKNREIIEDVLSSIFGEGIRVRCVLSENQPKPSKKYESGELTDQNISGPLDLSVVNVFDGALPL